jgi:hypothetical protein
MAREGNFFLLARGFTTILVALPPLNNVNSLNTRKDTHIPKIFEMGKQ